MACCWTVIEILGDDDDDDDGALVPLKKTHTLLSAVISTAAVDL